MNRTIRFGAFGGSVMDDEWGDDEQSVWDGNVTDDSSRSDTDDTAPPMWTPPADAPKPPVGYKYCYNPIVRGNTLTDTAATEKPNWQAEHWAGGDGKLYIRFVRIDGTTVWCCPSSTSSAVRPPKSDIIAIQQALAAAGYSPGTIDGLIGANTCRAMYAYAYAKRGYADMTLDEKLFESLGLGGRSFGVKYARLCDTWYSGEFGMPDDVLKPTAPLGPSADPLPKPTVKALSKKCSDGTILTWMSNEKEPICPKPPSPIVKPRQMSKKCPNGQTLTWMSNNKEPACPHPVAPKPVVKAGFPVWLGVLLGAGVLGAAVFAGKKGKKGRKGSRKTSRRGKRR